MEKSTISLLSTEDIAAIKSLGEALDKAAKASDWVALAALLTEDVVFYPPNAPAVKGRTTIQEWIESIGLKMLEHSFVFTEIDGQGDIAYGIATCKETFILGDVATPLKDEETVMGILRRQPDNSWKIDRWCWNSDSE